VLLELELIFHLVFAVNWQMLLWLTVCVSKAFQVERTSSYQCIQNILSLLRTSLHTTLSRVTSASFPRYSQNRTQLPCCHVRWHLVKFFDTVHMGVMLVYTELLNVSVLFLLMFIFILPPMQWMGFPSVCACVREWSYAGIRPACHWLLVYFVVFLLVVSLIWQNKLNV